MIRLDAVLGVAGDALRQHPLRSLLSILGLVIGVGALVSILALADGMERFAREQIRSTTNLQTISIAPLTMEWIDGVSVRRDTIAEMGRADAAALASHLRGRAVVVLVQQRPTEIGLDTTRTAAMLFAADAGIWSFRTVDLAAGRFFDRSDVEAARPVVVVSAALASRLAASPAVLVGRRIRLGEREAEVVGVLSDSAGRRAEAYGPFTAFVGERQQHPPGLFVRVLRAEEVPPLVREIEGWLDARFPGGLAAFRVMSDERRTQQIRQGMLLFKLVLGLITGISVLVGGIGVMNVLLVAVTERTREIGVRKAVGARRRDILLHFLTEALAISGVGSILGLLVGLGAVFAMVPVIRHFTETPFRPMLTWQTVLLVGTIAAAVGVVFGTYPAVRAARLSPVDAIRQE